MLLWGDFGEVCFWPIQVIFVVGGATFWCRSPLLSADNIILGHLMKMKLLVTDVTAIGTPGSAQRAVLGVILA